MTIQRNRNIVQKGDDPHPQNSPTITDLEKGLRIDEDALDEALLIHSDLFYRVSKQLTLLVSQRDAADQEKKEIEARVDAQLRHDAEVSESKTTEPQIKNDIRRDKDVIKAIDKLLELDKQVGQWQALKEAFLQRSYMLKAMCDLYIAGYFGANMDGASSRMTEHDADANRREMDRLRRERDADNEERLRRKQRGFKTPPDDK